MKTALPNYKFSSIVYSCGAENLTMFARAGDNNTFPACDGDRKIICSVHVLLKKDLTSVEHCQQA